MNDWVGRAVVGLFVVAGVLFLELVVEWAVIWLRSERKP